MNKIERQIENLLITRPSNLAELAQQLRVFIKTKTRPFKEIVFDSYNSINIGYGFTEKAWDCFCGIIIYSKHINISFPSGAELTDPHNVLRGSGKRVRHMRIESKDTINDPDVLDLIIAARDLAIEKAGIKILHVDSVQTIMKNTNSLKS